MTQQNSLSLPAAILINLNIMVGAGIFVNTVLLAQRAGAFGSLAYLIIAFLLLPLIITFAQLLRDCPGGTFYDYGALMHPFAGFVAGWSYFIAKLASASLAIHVFSTLMQQLVPFLARIPIFSIDIFLVIAFSILNTLNLRIGRSIQYGFLCIKLIPIFFAIAAGLYFFAPSSFYGQVFAVSGMLESLPFVLYAFTGFEACCSLSRTIQDPERNGPRALLISYSLGVLMACCYQFFFWSALGPQLASLNSYAQAFPTLLSHIFVVGALLYSLFFFLLNFGIAASSLGSAYGIIFSNTWNLFVLGQKQYTFFPSLITRFNRYKAPFICALVEGAIILSYLLLFRGELVPLQQICSLGMIITYTLSTLSFFVYSYTQRNTMNVVALIALLSCGILSFGYYTNIQKYGTQPTLYFALVLALGIGMFLIQKLRLARTCLNQPSS